MFKNCIWTFPVLPYFTLTLKFVSYILARIVVAFFFWAFFVYCFCVELDVIFLKFYNICIIIVYIVGIRCFCSHLLEAICKNRTCHKNLIAALSKKHASRELLSFKNFSYKEKSGYPQNKRENKRNAINKYFSSGKFMKWKIYFAALVLAALKCYFGVGRHKMQTSFKTLVSKHQHGDCTKPLSNAKLV